MQFCQYSNVFIHEVAAEAILISKVAVVHWPMNEYCVGTLLLSVKCDIYLAKSDHWSYQFE